MAKAKKASANKVVEEDVAQETPPKKRRATRPKEPQGERLSRVLQSDVVEMLTMERAHQFTQMIRQQLSPMIRDMSNEYDADASWWRIHSTLWPGRRRSGEFKFSDLDLLDRHLQQVAEKVVAEYAHWQATRSGSTP